MVREVANVLVLPCPDLRLVSEASQDLILVAAVRGVLIEVEHVFWVEAFLSVFVTDRVDLRVVQLLKIVERETRLRNDIFDLFLSDILLAKFLDLLMVLALESHSLLPLFDCLLSLYERLFLSDGLIVLGVAQVGDWRCVYISNQGLDTGRMVLTLYLCSYFHQLFLFFLSQLFLHEPQFLPIFFILFFFFLLYYLLAIQSLVLSVQGGESQLLGCPLNHILVLALSAFVQFLFDVES